MSTEKLQKIIARLEAKLEPISIDNEELKEKLELASVDRELAEERAKDLEHDLNVLSGQLKQMQALVDEAADSNAIIEKLSEESLSSKQLITELQNQISELEALSHLNHDLQSPQLIKQQALETQVQSLETQVSKHKALLSQSQLKIADLEQALASRSSAAPSRQDTIAAQEASKEMQDSKQLIILDLRQNLEVLKLELRQARLDLEAERTSPLKVLEKHLKVPDLSSLDIRMALINDHKSQSRVAELFELFKNGDIEDIDLRQQVLELSESNRSQVMGISDALLNAENAIDALGQYSSNKNFLRFSQHAAAIPKEILKDTVMDPNENNIKQILSLLMSQNPKEDSDTENQVLALESQLLSKEKELEATKLKLDILNSKADKAKDLASLVQQLDRKVSAMSMEKSTLEKDLEEVNTHLKTKDEEIEKLRKIEIPVNLDAATYQTTIKTMRSAIRHYMKSSVAKPTLEPLAEFTTARPYSGLAGHQVVRHVWDALETFKVADRQPGQPFRSAGRLAAEQARVLSLIDATGQSITRPVGQLAHKREPRFSENH